MSNDSPYRMHARVYMFLLKIIFKYYKLLQDGFS